jgi:hypothetical protein
MSYPLDPDIHEDVRTFPMYQRLRKITQHPMHLSFLAMGEKVVWIHFLKTSET